MKGGLTPITRGGTDIWHIPYSNAGYSGGFAGQGANLNTITIVSVLGPPFTRVVHGIKHRTGLNEFGDSAEMTYEEA